MVELRERGRGWVVLACGAGAATVVAMDGDGFFKRGCIHDPRMYGGGLWWRALEKVVAHGRDSTSPGRQTGNAR